MRMLCGVMTAVISLSASGLLAQTAAQAPKPTAPASKAPAQAPKLPTPTASGTPMKIGATAYERMDPTKLVEYLSELGIGTLVDAYAQELKASNPTDAKYAEAELIIMQARDISDPASYLAQMDKAIAKLKEVVAASAVPADPFALLRSYRYRVHLAEVMGSIQIMPYVEKLLFLQTGDEDRKVVVERTADAVTMFSRLAEDIRDKQTTLDAPGRMAIGSDLEELETAMVYKSAFAYLYRGLALTSDEKSIKAKTDCLRAAMTAVDRFVQDASNDTGMHFRAMLLSGQCSRELKEWDRAAEQLKAASDEGADKVTRLRANFEIGRMLAEKGEFDAAKTQVDKFAALAKETFGPAGAVTADIQTAFLKNYLYDTWAASFAKSNPAKSGEMAANAQKALMDFVNAHPDDASAFLSMIAARYVGQDPKNLNSMVIVAVAAKDLGKYPEDSPERAKNDAQALKTLQLVLDRNDTASNAVKPQALYTMAYIHSRNKRNIDAAKLFYEIADKSPDYQNAFNAIYNAVISYNTIIQDDMEKSESVPRQIREDLIKCYRKMYSKPEWAAQKNAQAYMFGYGYQLCKLGEIDEALVNQPMSTSAAASQATSALAATSATAWLIEAAGAFDKVSPDQPEYMEARYLAIEVRQKALRLTTDANAQRIAGENIVKLAKAYIIDAGKLLVKATADKKETEVKQLREWSARAELVIDGTMYEVLNLKVQALAQLASFGERWAGTDALKQSAQLLIQYSLLENKTEDAAAQVRKFREKYPDDAAGLIRLVINQLQKQIKTLRNDPSQKVALGNYRKAYYDFAKVLYDDNKKSNPNATFDQLCAYEQMLADATLELGQANRDDGKADLAAKNFADAMKAFETCKANDDKKRADALNHYQMKLENQTKAFQTPGLSVDVLAEHAEALLNKDLPDCGIDTRNFMAGTTLKMAIQAAKTDPTKPNLVSLQRAGQAACQRAIKQIEKGLPIDPVNMWGLARANRCTKNYSESLKWYSQLIAGLSKDRSSADYWEASLEYCEASLDSLVNAPTTVDVKEKAKQSSALQVRIHQLRGDDPNMGGMKARFGPIEAQAATIK